MAETLCESWCGLFARVPIQQGLDKAAASRMIDSMACSIFAHEQMVAGYRTPPGYNYLPEATKEIYRESARNCMVTVESYLRRYFEPLVRKTPDGHVYRDPVTGRDCVIRE
jgi:hypothetical protein